MKNLFKIGSVLGILLAVGIAVSCEKEEIVKTEEATIEVDENRMPMLIRPVLLAPDLVITSITSNIPIVSPSACGGGSAQEISCGSQYTLTIKVKNIGNAAVTTAYDLCFDKSTGVPAYVMVPSPSVYLAPGATHVFTIGPAPFGGCSGNPFNRQKLDFEVDCGNAIAELNEMNNFGTYQYCGD